MIITNAEFKKIVGPMYYNWETGFKNEEEIGLYFNYNYNSQEVEFVFYKNALNKEEIQKLFNEELKEDLERILIEPYYARKTLNTCYEHSLSLRFCALDDLFRSFGYRCITKEEYDKKRHFEFKPDFKMFMSTSEMPKITSKCDDFVKSFLKENISKSELIDLTTWSPFDNPFMDKFKTDPILNKIYLKPVTFTPKSFVDIVCDKFMLEIKKENEKENGKEKKMNRKRPDSIMIDEENKIIVAYLNGKRFEVKCKKNDAFDFRIGMGVVISKLNDYNVELTYLRNVMDWKKYYLYCYNKFFYFNTQKIQAFENAVLAEKEKFQLKVNEEKVRKFKCEEIEKVQYKPKKICHEFILINPKK